jgi:signal transduction histidine kinase
MQQILGKIMATSTQDPRLQHYIKAIETLKRGDYTFDTPPGPADEIENLGQSLRGLVYALKKQAHELQKLDELTTLINAGLLLDDILENIYQNFQTIIPYNRIGFALIEHEGSTAWVRSCWAKSDQPNLQLTPGYFALLSGSSLETIITTGQPRIINDLEAYLTQKPDSHATRLIVQEGIRSSLTCPLIATGHPVGFIFFSSNSLHTYADVHVDIFQRIARQLSVIVEKGRLVSSLADQKAAIEAQNKELQRLNELKNTFLGMTAHDLRGPLGLIKMLTHFLLEPSETKVSEDELMSFINDINRQASHMLVLINDLLDVSQIEAGKLTLNPEAISMQEFIREAVNRHAAMAASKGTRVISKTVASGQVTADPVRLRQVIDNLISNAVKFSPLGSTIQVSAQRLAAEWQIKVQDEGPGLTEDDQQHLFQNFARLSARPTGDEKSTGLGLVITRRIVEAHGGQIGVTSTPGQGANFWFTLPN